MKYHLRISVLRFCVLILILFLSVTLSADEQPGSLFLWETQIEKARVLMAGSIHILNEEFYPLPQPIEDAVDDADYLLLEADISSINPDEITSLVIRYGMYADGSTLADHIPEKLYAETLGVCKEYGIPEDQIQLMKPWLLSLTIESLSEILAGYDAALGMEMVLARYFEPGKIVELEGAAFQMELLGSMNLKDQILLLESSLDDSEEKRRLLLDLIDSWKVGDDVKMQQLIDGPDAAAGSLNRNLITNRNMGMVEKIIDTVSGTDSTYLVLVGSAHFLGDEGIPSLMEEKGYQVNRVLSDGSTIHR